MRCKGCDVVLSDSELLMMDDHGNYEELCTRCLRMSGIYTDIDTKDALDDEYVVDYPYDDEQSLIEELVGRRTGLSDDL